MLHNKEDVVEHNHDSKNKFNDIDFNIKAEHGLQPHLPKGEQPTRQIHQYVENRPPRRRLSLIIPIQLWQILKRGYSQFEIPKETDFPKCRFWRDSFSSLR